jgi:hypothetical protein
VVLAAQNPLAAHAMLSTTMALVPPRALGSVTGVLVLAEVRVPDVMFWLFTCPKDALPAPQKSRSWLVAVKISVRGEHSPAVSPLTVRLTLGVPEGITSGPFAVAVAVAEPLLKVTPKVGDAYPLPPFVTATAVTAIVVL